MLKNGTRSDTDATIAHFTGLDEQTELKLTPNTGHRQYLTDFLAMKLSIGCVLSLLGLLMFGCAKEPLDLPAHVIELNDLGVSKMGQFQYAAAHDDFSKVTEEAPYWDVGFVNLAIATLNRQEPDDELRTLELLQEVLTRNPDNVRALYTSGIVNLYLGHTEEAIQFLNEALRIDPDDAYTSYFLGQAHLQAGNYELAQQHLIKTLELNNALRSAYWAASTASRRLGDIDQATSFVEEYQAFEHNPLSVTAGFSYKQMGPKAEAKSVIANVVERKPKPEGSLFRPSLRLNVDLDQLNTISSFDFNQDGHWDVLVSDGNEARVLIGTEAGYVVESVDLAPHIAVAWGDMNNDGSTELLTCSEFGVAIDTFVDSGAQSRHPISNTDCQIIRVLDADHDGDLDVLTGGIAGLGIYYNDSNGKFIPYVNDVGLDIASPVTQVLAEDLDRDRDVDLVLIGNNAPNRVLRNELTWSYEPYAGLQEFSNEALQAVTALDVDVDGRAELITASEEGNLEVWHYGDPDWTRRNIGLVIGDVLALDAHDFDGDGRSDLFVATREGFKVIDPRTSSVLFEEQREDIQVAIPVYVNARSGPSVIVASSSAVEIFHAGPGRHAFLAISPSGKTSADQMRSNASGIGTYIKLRVDSRWSVASSFSFHSGASQSLIPVMFGSGGADQADYAELLWSDGVTQSEIALSFGEIHRIEEIQRQLASCPVVFIWNGEKYEFVSDVLGVAALGYFAEPGVTTPIRTKERLILPDGLLRPRAGNFEVKIGEPMEEILYLDSASLLYFDVPTDWSMTLDERLNVKSATPTSDPIYFRETYDPVRATTNLERDVVEEITKTDRRAVDPGPIDPRFIGLLADEFTLELEFGTKLPERNAVLVADGWVEFPYSQTSFAAYQANTKFEAPTIEARDSDGEWHVVAEEFGFPGGMPRQISLSLPSLPKGTRALRLRSNLEIYWDRIRIVKSSVLADAKSVQIRPNRAVVRSPGFADRTTGPQRTPYYDYNNRLTYGDAKLAAGMYTVTGNVTELVLETDSAVAIVGSGEEVHLEFAVPSPPKKGFQRYYALEFQGWAKDMDLYTENGDTVEPLPTRLNVTEDQLKNRDLLHARYNVRYQSGIAVR